MPMIEQALCNSYKLETMQGIQRVEDEYHIALYTSKAVLNKHTKVYTEDGEVIGQGYSKGGIRLTSIKVWLQGDNSVLKWDSLVIPRATITARGALIYNVSRGNRAVAVLDFGEDISSTRDDYKIEMPETLIEWR
jgi:hypothetical protein